MSCPCKARDGYAWFAGRCHICTCKMGPREPCKIHRQTDVWEATQQHIREMLVELDIPFVEETGGAAFYGPKVDINAKNVYGKEDTMITVQWDALLAAQFDMFYIDQNGEKVRPYIIHRTSMGCYERTLAWLIEKYEGKFPLGCAPNRCVCSLSRRNMANMHTRWLPSLKERHPLLGGQPFRKDRLQDSRCPQQPHSLYACAWPARRGDGHCGSA